MDAHEQAGTESSSERIGQWLRAIIGVPLLLLGGVVTTILGLILCLYILSRITGASPMHELTSFFFGWLIFGAAPLAVGIVLFKKSYSKQDNWWKVLVGMLLLFLVVAADANLGPTNWHNVFRGEKSLGTEANSLHRTWVTPTLDAQISKGTNVLWCGTFQLAWNEACRLTGGDLKFQKPNYLISALNKHSFTGDSLDAASFVAMAGFVRDGIHDKISKAVAAKFKGTFKPQFIPDKALTPRPQDMVAYACLYKNLDFQVPFERLDDKLTFDGVKTPAFGFADYKRSLEKIYPQVSILDYVSENDFVIELKSKATDDRLILAKVKPGTNLAELVTSIGNRIANRKGEIAATNDVLMVPRVKMDITREYSEIEGLALIPKATNVATGLVILSAVQNTKFEMNEKGVELKSEAHMAFGCAQQPQPNRPHVMIFDKPFLILMQRRGATVPYFALWVDNAEVLVSWK